MKQRNNCQLSIFSFSPHQPHPRCRTGCQEDDSTGAAGGSGGGRDRVVLAVVAIAGVPGVVSISIVAGVARNDSGHIRGDGRGTARFHLAERGAAITIELVAVVTFLIEVLNGITAGREQTVGAADGGVVGIDGVPAVTLLAGVGFEDTVATGEGDIEDAGRRAAVVIDGVAVITLLAFGGLDDAVAAGALFEEATVGAAVVVTGVVIVAFLTGIDVTVATEREGFTEAGGAAAVAVDAVAVVTLFAGLHAAVAAGGGGGAAGFGTGSG